MVTCIVVKAFSWFLIGPREACHGLEGESAVAPMAFDHRGYGYGFNVVNERGRPLAQFHLR